MDTWKRAHAHTHGHIALTCGWVFVLTLMAGRVCATHEICHSLFEFIEGDDAIALVTATLGLKGTHELSEHLYTQRATAMHTTAMHQHP